MPYSQHICLHLHFESMKMTKEIQCELKLFVVQTLVLTFSKVSHFVLCGARFTTGSERGQETNEFPQTVSVVSGWKGFTRVTVKIKEPQRAYTQHCVITVRHIQIRNVAFLLLRYTVKIHINRKTWKLHVASNAIVHCLTYLGFATISTRRGFCFFMPLNLSLPGFELLWACLAYP